MSALVARTALGQTVTLSVSNVCADPGATAIQVPIALDSAVAVRGLSFVLQDSPDELQLTSGRTAATCTDRTAGFTCTANEVTAANVVNALVISLSGDDIAAGTGPVAVLTLTDGPVACTPGEQVALALSNVMVASLNGTALPATVENGTFTCGCAPTSTTTSSSSTSTSTTTSSSTTSTTTTTSSSTTTMPAAVVTVSVPADLCVDPGATVDVPVSLENAGAVRGLSFALQDTPDELQLASGPEAAAC